MYTYLLQSSTCLIVLYGIYHFILADLTFFRHNRAYLLWALVISLIVPLAVPYLVLPQEQVPVIHWSYVAMEMDTIYVSYNDKLDYLDKLWMFAAFLYFMGMLVVLSRMIYGIIKIIKYHQSGVRETKNGYNIITTKGVHLPFSFFNSVYISRHVPLSDHIQTILDHEKIHTRHWHTVDVLFAEIVQAFYWFNPVMIFYKRALRQAHEYLADDIICRDKSVSSYTDLLLSKSQSGMEMALANQFFSSQIKKRIHMMTKNKTDRHAAWKYALVMPLLLGLVVVFSSPEIKGDIQKVIADIITDTIPATQSANLNDVQTQSIKNLPKLPAPSPPPPLSGPEKTEPDHMELLNILLTRQSTERPLLIVDGEEKETNYLSRKGYMSGDVTIILPSEAEKIYGEAAKYGCVKIANPKFDINKVVDAFYKHVEDGENIEKLSKVFYDSENTDSTKFYENKVRQILDKTKPALTALLSERESRSLDVNLTRLAKGEEVKLPATFKIKKNDSQEDVQIKKGDLFVSGNGIRLEEDIDYVVDYGKSTIKITNPFVINGKQSLNVSFKK